jgi:hypothetical protein
VYAFIDNILIMGFREWGFLIKSRKDIDKIINLILNHNSLPWDYPIRGEDLVAYSIIQSKNDKKYYLCVGSEGGGDIITKYILSNYDNINTVYLPFEKPKWWNIQSKYTYIWKAKCPNDPIISPWDL